MFNTQYRKTIPLGPALAALLLAAAVGIAVLASQLLTAGSTSIPGTNDGKVSAPFVSSPSTWTQDAAQRRAGSTHGSIQHGSAPQRSVLQGGGVQGAGGSQRHGMIPQ